MADTCKVLICCEPLQIALFQEMIPWTEFGCSDTLFCNRFSSIAAKSRSFKADIVILDLDIIEENDPPLSSLLDKLQSDSCILIGNTSLYSVIDFPCVFAFIAKPINLTEIHVAVSRLVKLRLALTESSQRISSMQDSLDQVRPILLQNLALLLIQGRFNHGSNLLNKKSMRIGLNFEFNHYTCYVASLISGRQQAKNDATIFEALRSNMKTFITKYSNDHKDLDTLTLHEDSYFTIIAGYQRPDHEEIISNFVNTMFESIKKLFLYDYVIVQGDTTDSVYDIAQIYHQAERVCNNHIFIKRGGSLKADDFSDSAFHILEIPSDFPLTLEKHIIRRDKTQLKLTLQYLCDSILKYGLFDKQYLICKTKELVFTIRKDLLETYPSISEQMPSFVDIDDCTYIEQLFDRITAYFISLSDVCHEKMVHVEDDDMNLVMKIRSYIEKYYAKPITLKAAARDLYYSPNYLGRIFYQSEGIRFSEYLHKVRIQNAIHLLSTSEDSLQSIACEVGYNDVCYFYRKFKEIVGMTPVAYLKEVSKQSSEETNTDRA